MQSSKESRRALLVVDVQEGLVAKKLHGCVRATCIGAKALGLGVDLLSGGHSTWAPDAAAKIEAAERELAAAGIGILGIDRL